jgi:MinD superfamily P-loop ATPase
MILAVASGKGGTGKTTVSVNLARVFGRSVQLLDCDVEEPNGHLILSPRISESHDFRSGHVAVIRQSECSGCGACLTLCRFDAVRMEQKADGEAVFFIDPIACQGCGVCVRFCPVNAIDFPERLCGEWMVSDTRRGPMVHARLGIAVENSGKLVSTVRLGAKRIAEEENRSMVIVDGPPGIGCAVIASVTGASSVLVVTEPTLSGEHDLGRVLSLVRHFNIPAVVCVNKWDINPEMTERIEAGALQAGAQIAGRIRYDLSVTQAQMTARAVVELDSPAAADVRKLWKSVIDGGTP